MNGFVSNISGLSIEEVVNRIASKDDVDGVLVTGSRALKPYSDVDIVILLKQSPTKLFSVFAYINLKVSDILFYYTDEIDQLLLKKSVDADERDAWILNWVNQGEIISDKSGRFNKLKEMSNQISIKVSDEKKYKVWFKINYNFLQNKRYFDSGDPLYHQALEIRLLYSVVEVLGGYLTLNGKAWQGEKNVVIWLEKNAPMLLKLFKDYSTASVLDKKMNLYQQMVELTLKQDLWNKAILAVNPLEDFSNESLEAGFKFWNSLIS